MARKAGINKEIPTTFIVPKPGKAGRNGEILIYPIERGTAEEAEKDARAIAAMLRHWPLWALRVLESAIAAAFAKRRVSSGGGQNGERPAKSLRPANRRRTAHRFSS